MVHLKAKRLATAASLVLLLIALGTAWLYAGPGGPAG